MRFLALPLSNGHCTLGVSEALSAIRTFLRLPALHEILDGEDFLDEPYLAADLHHRAELVKSGLNECLASSHREHATVVHNFLDMLFECNRCTAGGGSSLRLFVQFDVLGKGVRVIRRSFR